MALTPGTRLGVYEITAAIGSGGMGEVYRARDSRLGRDVAIKVLPADVATDRDRLARFEREAQILASLNHPNIAHIHGLDDSTGVPALVMELVEGSTLADRIAQGPIPIDEALPIAEQIATGLEAAHEQGIIHRDLKPANIKVTHDGTVKILDFGLAKALEPSPTPAGNSTESPTITTPAMMTGIGTILGTAAYMSPEQAKGRPADKRSDLWAFGCVLYEMLTGSRAFEGEDVGDTLANVLKTEPDWSVLPDATPPSIRRLLGRCLAKDRKRRLSDAGVARLEIDEPPIEGGKDRGPAIPTPRSVHIVWGATVIVVAAVAAFLAWMMTARAAAPVPPVRFVVTLPEGPFYPLVPYQPVALSTDGGSFLFGVPLGLLVHSFADGQTRTIVASNPGANPSTPIASPDGRWLAFFQTSGSGMVALKKVLATGGPAITLAQQLPSPFGATWSNGYIVFGTRTNGVMRVSEDGGTPEIVAAPAHGEVMQSPQVLPGGDTLLMTVAPPLIDPGQQPSNARPTADWDHADVVVQSLKTGQRRTLMSGAADARYAPSGHLVFVRSGVLFAAPFDPHRLVVGGEVKVVEGVQRTMFTGAAVYAFSSNGSLVYLSGPISGAFVGTTLAWTATTGTVERLAIPAGTYETPRIALDGLHAAVTYTDSSGTNVWIVDLSGAHQIRRLTDGGRNKFPVWSPGGDRIVFQSDRAGDLGMWTQRSDGSGPAERLTTAPRGAAQVPESWSPDGKHLLFSSTEGSDVTLWTLSLETRMTEPFGKVRSTQPTNAVFSPNGHWVAYGSTESGTPAVYVQPFPATEAKYPVSHGDIGHHALWSRDGNRLFYIPRPGELVFVTVTTERGFEVSQPTSVPRGFTIGNTQQEPRNHDIAKDGRLLGIVPAEKEGGPIGPPHLNVVLHWFEELKMRVPVK